MKTLNLLRTLGTQAITGLKSWAPTRRRRRPAVSEEPVEAMGLETLEGRVLMSTTMFMADADTTTQTVMVASTDTTQDGDRTSLTTESETNDASYTLIETSTQDSASDLTTDTSGDTADRFDDAVNAVVNYIWDKIDNYHFD